MQFINDDESAMLQMRYISLLREHNREAFRRGYEEGRTIFAKICAIRRGGVASTRMDSEFLIQVHASDGSAEIFLDIVGQGAQGRDVEALHAIDRLPAVDLAKEKVEHAKKTRQCFAASRGGCEQDRAVVQNRRDAEQLRLREGWERFLEPAGDTRVKAFAQMRRINRFTVNLAAIGFARDSATRPNDVSCGARFHFDNSTDGSRSALTFIGPRCPVTLPDSPGNVCSLTFPARVWCAPIRSAQWPH
jgi:hypothetical protein